MQPRRTLLLAVVAALAAFHLVLASRWTSQDRQPPGWDPAVHLGTAQDYRDAWRQGRWLDLLRTAPRPGHPQYPPIYHYTLTTVLSSGAPHRTVVWLNLAYLLVFLAAASRLAWRLGGMGPAVAALICLGLSPGVLYKFREVFPDLSLAAWTTLTYALLVESGFFQRRRLSLLVGLCTGLAVLSKWGAVLYLLPAALSGLRDAERRRNLSLALAVAAVICLPWYLVNSLQMLPRIWTSVTLGHHQGQPLTWTWDNWLYYWRFLEACFSFPGALLMLAGAVWAVEGWRRAGRRWNAPQIWLAGWLGFSYLFCTAVPSKDDRYFLPAAAALPVLGLSALPVPALLLAGGLAVLNTKTLRAPEPAEWHSEDILRSVESRRRGPFAVLSILSNHRHLNATALTWLARQHGLSALFMGGHQSEIPEWADFIVVKTAEPGPFLSDATRAILNRERAGGGLFHKVYREAESWPLPDGSRAILYEPRPEVALITVPRTFAELRVKGTRLFDVDLRPSGPEAYDLSIARVELSKLASPIRDVRVRLEGARLIEDSGSVYVLGVKKVRLLRARNSGSELGSALTARSGLPIGLDVQDGLLTASAKLAGLTLSISLRAAVRAGGLDLELRGLRLTGLRLPFTDGIRLRYDLSPRPPFQPYALELEPLIFSPQGISIGA